MSIFKVDKSDLESFTVVTNPWRTYSSSSVSGSIGSVNVFPRRSTIEKESGVVSSFVDDIRNDSTIDDMLRTTQQVGRYARSSSTSIVALSASARFSSMVDGYLSAVNDQAVSTRKHKALDIVRFNPTTTFTANTSKKLTIKDVLSCYHRVAYPSAHWAYTNYSCLSFFTSSTVPTSSCLLYPNASGGDTHEGYVDGIYMPSGAISFDFYINPRYQQDQANGAFKAGTLFHMSSTYAVSLITGSRKDENGKSVGFMLQLQLSSSADVEPSLAKPGTGQNAFTFRSDDNSLLWNRWQHVVIRWGTEAINAGTGSFVVDGVEKGTFVFPSSTIAPRTFTNGTLRPSVLCVGNYLKGGNFSGAAHSLFFAADPALRDGLTELTGTTGVDEPAPSAYRFEHPLNADVHDLSIKRFYMTDLDIEASSSQGPKSLDAWTMFYLPVFFVEESPFRQFVGDIGGILQTPFFEVDGTTNDPFNVAMSFGVGGHYINIENYLRDFAGNTFPRVHHMSGVALTHNTALRTANEFLYDQPFVRRRNSLIMPCDDGLFVPAYELLASESRRTNAVDDLGVEELSFVNMSKMLSTSSALFGSDFDGDSTFADESIGFTPERPGTQPGAAFVGYARNVDKAIASGTFDPGIQDGAPLTIYQRTRDASSNQVTFFDISNLFYGHRIMPGSLVLSDSSLSGSGGAQSITLKDDGHGTLYRADCLTSASTWNSVGTVFYDEGIIAIKNPHIYFFGKEQFELSFRGEQNVHVMKVDVIAPAHHLNSSSNKNYVKVPPSPYPNDPEKEFVYISTINFHDDNLNVVMKTQLAQPIMKRPGDRIAFKVRFDV